MPLLEEVGALLGADAHPEHGHPVDGRHAKRGTRRSSEHPANPDHHRIWPFSDHNVHWPARSPETATANAPKDGNSTGRAFRHSGTRPRASAGR